MKKNILLSVLLFLSLLSTAGASIREKYNFNPDWKFFIGDDSNAAKLEYDDSKWKLVNLPAAFNQLADTVVWYRKNFSVSSEYKGQKVFIEFEGAGQTAEIWVNGQKVGLHEDGVMAFGFDLSNLIKFGNGKENLIAVRVVNALNEKNGGLNRNVFLHITDKLYQTLPLYSNLKTKGIYVFADNFDVKGKRAVLHIESEVRNDYDKPKTLKLNVIVRDNEKALVREFQTEEVTLQPGETKVVTATASMKNLKFWSWGYGYLYEVNTSVVVGNNVVDLVRTKTGFRKTDFANGLFKLNDRTLQLKGYAQSSTNEWPGVGSSVPVWLSDYSNNLMLESNANLVRWMYTTPWKQDVESCDRIGLIESMPASDSEKYSEDRTWEKRKEVMRDAIIYNRNNPSIIFYECGNKGISEDHMAEMLALKKEFDPNGGRAMGCRDMLDSKIAEYGGDRLYVNKSANEPVWVMEYGRDTAINNQNQDLFAKESVARWFDFWRERPGTGRRVNSGAASYLFSDGNTGKVDAMRIKNEAWWAHYVMWDGWVDLENFHTRIVGHWNYEKGTQKNVYVVSSGDQVELFLNNKSLGFGEQTNRFWFTFKNVTFMPGELRAVSYDNSKKIVSETKCTTAGNPTSLKLNLIQGPDSLHADGADMVLVEVEVLDAKGQRCPLATNKIDFEVKGPVEFLGGTGQDEKDHLIHLSVEAGINRILLRSTREAGPVTILAKSENLGMDTLSFISKKVSVMKGLSTYLPGLTQPASLTKGETQSISSYTVSRIPVSLMDVSAGSNEKNAFFSFDDNERSEWRSCGARSNAWINYVLTREAELSEICLKLSGWKNTTYPLRVLNENGLVLWEGTTETSYGYVTLPLKKGILSNAIRIELPGAGKEKDSVTTIPENDPTMNLDILEKNEAAKDQLRIIEVEFYEPAR